MSALTAEEITRDWGERCPEHNDECSTCQMWAMHDEIETLRAELANARDEALEEAGALVDDMIDEDSYPLSNRHLISRAIRRLKGEGESRSPVDNSGGKRG